MAIVFPFRGLRYDPRFAGQMDRIVAPPYDVINERDRTRYEQAHPKNVVRLILPGEAGKAEDGSFYAGAAALLEQWRREGTLRQDSGPALYPYRQTYQGPDGTRASRLGFLGALALEKPGSGGGALPHEKTLEAPRKDRTRLIAACRANLSPIFLLHPDATGAVGDGLARAVEEEPVSRFTDSQGVLHELWKMDDREAVEAIRQGMAADWTLIADGHHRYESAQAVMEQLPQVEGARFVLAFFCSLQDSGFRIFPIHRLVRARGKSGEAIGNLLAARLPMEPVEIAAGPEEALSRLRMAGAGSFVAILPGGSCFLLRAGERIPGAPEANSLDALDTVVLEREILTGILGITAEAISQGAVGYTPDAREALRAVESREAAAAFLLNPLRVEAVVQAARSGLRLPQKSTYFFPKVFTGLVIRPF